MRTAFEGRPFSAPMDWSGMVQQFESMKHNEAYRCVPARGEAFAARVQIDIQVGLLISLYFESFNNLGTIPY